MLVGEPPAQGAALLPAPLGGTQENHKWQVKDKTFISQQAGTELRARAAPQPTTAAAGRDPDPWGRRRSV